MVHCSWFIVHSSLFMFIAHCSLSIVHCSLLIVHCSLFIVHCSLFIVHCPLFIAHCSLTIAHYSLFIIHSLHCSLPLHEKSCKMFKPSPLIFKRSQDLSYLGTIDYPARLFLHQLSTAFRTFGSQLVILLPRFIHP